MSAKPLGLGAIVVWALLNETLTHVPLLQSSGPTSLVGSLIALPLSRFDFRQ